MSNPYEITPLPRKLLEAPGLLGHITGWINNTAIMYQPELALGNAIAFTGALVGRKVESQTGLRTNFYTLGVGESCCGKDHSRTQMLKLAEAAGLDERSDQPGGALASAGHARELIAGEDVTSEAAILYWASQNPSSLFQFDEIGHFFSQNKSPNASSHEKAIIPTLTKLFTSANKKFKGKQYAESANKPRVDIDQPNICMYGTATPGQFWDSLEKSQIADGFMGRLLVFTSSEIDPDRRTITDQSPSDSLVESVRAWGQFGYPGGTTIPVAEGTGNIAAATAGPLVLKPTSDASRVLSSYQQEWRETRRTYIDRGSPFHPLWGRAWEQASKLALLASLGDSPPTSVDELYVVEEAATWACELVNALILQMIKQAGAIAETPYERNFKRVERAILDYHEPRIPKNVLSSKTQFIKSREREEILADMQSQELIVYMSEKRGMGRPAVYIGHDKRL